MRICIMIESWISICFLALLHSVTVDGTPPWSSGPMTLYETVGASGVHGHTGESHNQVVKVILVNGGGSASSGYGGFSHGHSYVGGPIYHAHHSQVYKVHDLGIGPNYRHSHSNSHTHSINSQLTALLPQILQIILQNDASGDGYGSINSQLISAYDHEGSATITRTKGHSGHDLRGGHVVQEGTLHVTRVENSPGFGGKSGGGISWSSH